MFESNSNVNSHPPMLQTSPSNHFSNINGHHQDPNPSYSYLNFPSQLLDDDELFLGTVLPYSSPLPHIPPPLPPPPPPPSLPPSTKKFNHTSRDPGEQKAKDKGKRKRAVGKAFGSGGGGGGGGGDCGGSSGAKTKRRRGKTDRHSKIHTAKGPRDRRMRLSLQIARKFFDLQDMLGFDKASKTIEWLFNKSKGAIKDLSEKSCTAMAPSSPSDQDNTNVHHGEDDEDDDEGDKDKRNKGKKGGLLFQAMRENREKARARARERTKEKLLMMQQHGNDQQNPNCGCNNATIRVDQIMDQSQYVLDDDDEQHQQLSLEDQMASVGIIEKYLTTSSSSVFDFHHDNHYYQHISRVTSTTMLVDHP